MSTLEHEFFQPVSAMEPARFAGIPTFMRLPSLTPEHPK
jgi:guanidinopropionase